MTDNACWHPFQFGSFFSKWWVYFSSMLWIGVIHNIFEVSNTVMQKLARGIYKAWVCMWPIGGVFQALFKGIPLNQFRLRPSLVFLGEGGHWTSLVASGRVSTELGSPMLVKARKGCGFQPLIFGGVKPFFGTSNDKTWPMQTFFRTFRFYCRLIFSGVVWVHCRFHSFATFRRFESSIFVTVKAAAGGVSTGCLTTQRSFSQLWFATVGYPKKWRDMESS